MSADNWDVCPQCVDRAEAKRAELVDAAARAYGNVPAEEYEAMRDLASPPTDPEAFRTFREDYEFYGATDGTVTASYSGHCDVCHLSVSFKHEHPFYERSPR